ncbi:MAG: small basic protein [Planctomycetes bacterium]|nr:small basic protein [Planctomycetota bacterium]
MSIDRSLRLTSSLVRHRNVLTRAERVAQLKERQAWSDDQSALGLPKVSHRKVKAAKKKSKAAAAAEEGATKE